MDAEDKRDYFELKITNNGLTNDYILEINDFANEDEIDDIRGLWELQVEALRRTYGF